MAEAAAAILGPRLETGLVVTNVGGSRGRGPSRLARGRWPAIPCPTRAACGPPPRWSGCWPAWARATSCSCCSRAAPRRCCPRRPRGLRLADKARTTVAPAAGGSHHPRAEHGAQAPLAPQGRRPRPPGGARARPRPRALRRRGRRPLDHRLGARVSPDPTTFADALAVLAGRGLLDRVPAAVREHLGQARAAGPRDPQARRRRSFAACSAHVVGGNRAEPGGGGARGPAAGLPAPRPHLPPRGRGAGGGPRSWSRSCASASPRAGRRRRPSACWRGERPRSRCGAAGQGGRNQEMAVAAAPRASRASRSRPSSRAWPPTASTGGATRRGGSWTGRRWRRARALGLAPPAGLPGRSDSRSFLGPVGGLIVTGPTGTNVMDLDGPPGLESGAWSRVRSFGDALRGAV